VLCSVRDQDAALAEIRRVLKPDGALLFIEHVRADDEKLARWQDRLERPWRVVAMGCHPNRATLERIEAGGFAVEELRRGELPRSAPIVRPMILGRAVARV
jgi:SAM-dependent methyltransferase